MRQKSILLLVSLVICLIAYSRAFADQRSYVWTYEYMTMPKGMWEVENYITTEVPNLDKSNIYTIKEWVELEYGITDNWDVAMYQMYKYNNKKAESDSEYDGFKLRTRYRFGKKGQFIVDPLIYLEYIRSGNFSKPNVVEVKLILAKDIGDLNLSYNQILKRDLESRGKTDHEYAAGIGYALSPNFKFGIESKGNYSKKKYALGPTVSFSRGRFWAALGAAFGLSKAADDLQTRLIFGVLF